MYDTFYVRYIQLNHAGFPILSGYHPLLLLPAASCCWMTRSGKSYPIRRQLASASNGHKVTLSSSGRLGHEWPF